MRLLLLLALLPLAVIACDHSSSSGAQTSATASVAATTSSVAASASAATKTPDATRAWRGTYKSVASTLAAPPDGKKTHWSDTQTTAGIGDGALALTVDGATGHVSGTVDGPLGPAMMDGVVTDGKLAATLRRKDPTDQGFTGTILGSIAGDHLEGTMNVSIGLANALRTATFTLTPSGPAP
ncbi:MAG TPA: hypothetical protein VIJ22_01555 [Polyangiaceae bacterium]